MKYILGIIIFLFSPILVKANLIFTEIMYDLPGTDTDREWVEIYNNGSLGIDLTGYKFNDGSNHVLNPPPENGGQGSFFISAGEYIILSGNASTFLSEHPGFSSTVIDTVMSLANTGDTLSLIDSNGQNVANVSYQNNTGTAGTGATLQFINGDWQIGNPTPGLPGNISDIINEEEDTNNNTTTNESSSSNSSSLSNVSNNKKEKSKEVRKEILLDLSSIPKNVISGNKVIFNVSVFGLFDEKFETGRFEWSFGDGGTKENIGNESFYYIYKYPGEYVITLRYFKKPNDTKITPDQIAKKTIIVTSPNMVIDSVGTDGSIVLLNESTEERDIGGWKITYNNQIFTFPDYTIILPKKRFTLGSHLSGIYFRNDLPILLISESGEEISRYPKIMVSPSVVKNIIKSNKTNIKTSEISTVSNKQDLYTLDNKGKSLSASVSNVESRFFSSSFLSLLGLIILAIISVFSVKYFSLKKKKYDSEEESSFEIIE